MTFYGEARGDKHTHEHAHESPMTMIAPLGVLAVGAVLAGMVWYKPFFGDHHKVEVFFGIPTSEVHAAGRSMAAPAMAAGDRPKDEGRWREGTAGEGDGDAGDRRDAGRGRDLHGAGEHGSGRCASCARNGSKPRPFIAMLLGFLTAYQFYIRSPDLPGKLAESQRPLYQFLLNKWYFDEIYDAIFTRPAKALGRFLWTRGDGNVIDGGINGLAMGIIPFFTRLAGRAQSGYLFHYAFAMVLGIVVLITWMTMTGGAE